MWFYVSAASVSGTGIVTEVGAVWHKKMRLKKAPLARSFFAQRHTDLLKQFYTILEGFADRMGALPRVQRALNQPDAFYFTAIKDVE